MKDGRLLDRVSPARIAWIWPASSSGVRNRLAGCFAKQRMTKLSTASGNLMPVFTSDGLIGSTLA
jgi:hypothetical protein